MPDLPRGEVLTPAFDPQRHTVDFAFVDKCTKKKSYTDANFPCDEFGATYHLGTKVSAVPTPPRRCGMPGVSTVHLN